MLSLCQFDLKVANIGKLYMGWYNVQESLNSPQEPTNCLIRPWKAPFNKAKQDTLNRYVHARWVSTHSPLHSVTFLLDSTYWNMELDELDEEVIEDFYDVVSKFYDNADDQAQAVSDLIKYKLKEGLFSSEFVQNMAAKQTVWRWCGDSSKIMMMAGLNGM